MNQGNKKRNISIQLIRVIAMSMILCDHIIIHISFPMKSMVIQIFNSGVFIFLFISGYLYGNKQVINWKEWFINRLVKICIPMWIFMVIDFVIEVIVWNNFDVKDIFIYAFNLQGIFSVNAIGAEHLWFLTLIMICYIITPLLQWIKSKRISRLVGILILLGAVTIQVISAYVTDIGMVVGHTLSWCIIAVGNYVAGYFIGTKILSKDIGMKKIGITSVLAVVSSVVVIMFNRKFDGQVIYDRIIIYYGLLILDLWLCIIAFWVGKHIKSSRIVCLITHFDTISYEVYIVHVLILFILLRKFNGLVYVVGTLVISYIAAWILHEICKVIYKGLGNFKI